MDDLTAFVYLRSRNLTDDLVDLLIETIHHIGARAERQVERELLDDLKRVTGKQNLLFELDDATLVHPNGVVRDVVYLWLPNKHCVTWSRNGKPQDRPTAPHCAP